jgi:hypothetical protein
VERYFWQLIGTFLLFCASAYARLSITSARDTEAKAKQLASFALQRLAEQAAWHAYDPRGYPENWISMVHLRDEILRDDFSASSRAKLWAKVQKKVEQNSNVRPMMREGRSGDMSRVWEWVGAVRAIEDGRAGDESGSRRKSGRYSTGTLIGSSPPALVPVKEDREEMEQLGKWDEGRPIY